MKPVNPKKDRRVDDKIAFIERRKGKIWMYIEILLAVGLILYLLRLLLY
jgi:hypothetical protein